MNIISLHITNINEIITKDLISLNITEKELAPPVAKITLPINFAKNVSLFDSAKIYIESVVVFSGIVNSIQTSDKTMVITIAPAIINNQNPAPDTENFTQIFDWKHKDLRENLEIEETTKLGEKIKVSLLDGSSNINIWDDIIDGSLKISSSRNDVVSKVTLDIEAYWVSKHFGDLDISSKIAHKFRDGKVNTMTPLKLKDSWPAFGEKIRSNSRQTKYFIGYSRLREDDSINSYTKPIKINDETPEFSMKRTYFDNKLIISWEFDQFRKESVRAIVINKESLDGCEKNITLNLKNVQEFIDEEEKSFISSIQGEKILEYIYKIVGNYIALSMRNIEISLDIPFKDDPEFINIIGVDKWINIKKYKVKITEIEYDISHADGVIKIKGKGYKKNFRKVSLKNPKINQTQDMNFDFSDIVSDIIVQNDADTQLQKLIDHVMTKAGSINGQNYQDVVTKFLNKNQTEISILTRPLKTKHCEERVFTIDKPVEMTFL